MCDPPSCAQNTGMTDPPNLKIFRLYGITMHITHHRVKPWWYWSHLWRAMAGLHWNTDRLRIRLLHFYSLSAMIWCGFQWLCHCDTKCRARGVGRECCMERNSWAQQYLVLHRLPGILYQNQLEVLLYMWGRKVIAINYRVQKCNIIIIHAVWHCILLCCTVLKFFHGRFCVKMWPPISSVPLPNIELITAIQAYIVFLWR